jgi:hypothetical protein
MLTGPYSELSRPQHIKVTFHAWIVIQFLDTHHFASTFCHTISHRLPKCRFERNFCSICCPNEFQMTHLCITPIHCIDSRHPRQDCINAGCSVDTHRPPPPLPTPNYLPLLHSPAPAESGPKPCHPDGGRLQPRPPPFSVPPSPSTCLQQRLTAANAHRDCASDTLRSR